MSRCSKFVPCGTADDSLSSGYFSREDSLIPGGPFPGECESADSCAEPADAIQPAKKCPTMLLSLPARTATTGKDIRTVPATRERKRKASDLVETPKSHAVEEDGQDWMDRVNSAVIQRVSQMGREPSNLEVLLLAASEIDKDPSTSRNFPVRRNTKRKGVYNKSGNSYKCRKVFGLDQKNRWCNQCRWKKSCIRDLRDAP